MAFVTTNDDIVVEIRTVVQSESDRLCIQRKYIDTKDGQEKYGTGIQFLMRTEAERLQVARILKFAIESVLAHSVNAPAQQSAPSNRFVSRFALTPNNGASTQPTAAPTVAMTLPQPSPEALAEARRNLQAKVNSAKPASSIRPSATTASGQPAIPQQAPQSPPAMSGLDAELAALEAQLDALASS